MIKMYYVYRIQSVNKSEKFYTGYTSDLKRRLKEHNSNKLPNTAKYSPWKIIYYSAFQNKKDALAFERYLKSGSGIAFAARRLWPDEQVKVPA